MQAQPARVYAPRPQGAEGSMGSDAFYNARGLLWESLPRPANAVGALATGFNPAGQPAFVPRPANTAGAGDSYGK